MTMRTTLLVAATILAAGCSWRSTPKAAARSQADTLQSDNQWIFGAQAPGTPLNAPIAPQSTPIATFYQQSLTALHTTCPSPCRGAIITVSLLPTNVTGAPAPDHPYSAKAVQHFVDGLNQLLTFLPTAGLDAVSMSRSLTDLQSQAARVRQHVVDVPGAYAQKKQAIIDSASQQIKDAAGPVISDEMRQLATTKGVTQALQTIVADYTSAAAALAGDFQVTAKSYNLYRGLEVGVTQQLTQLATSAATADIEALAQLQVQLRDIDVSESNLAEQLEVTIARQRALLGDVQASYDARIAPYADFLATNKMAKPDATAVALASLQSMNGYCLQREDRMRAAIDQVADGLSRRVTALLTAATDAATQTTLLASAQLHASSDFVAESNARLAHLWSKLPTSTVLKLSFLSAKYDEMTAFLQLEPICASTPPAYMQTGCLLLKPQFSKAHDWINRTAPSVIRIQAMMMKSAGIDAAKTDAVVAEANAGHTAQAAFDQDILLRDDDLAVANVDGGVEGDE
jgi:hypothetical protein